MIHTKCILHAIEPRDGVRISVMPKHEFPNGVKITPEQYRLWFDYLAPPENLFEGFKGKLQLSHFELRYLGYLRTEQIAHKVRLLAKFALTHDITLMCIDKSADNSYRRWLAEEMQRYEPELKIEHH
jgi:uncharacterized protein YeaO (DUF488 family)